MLGGGISPADVAKETARAIEWVMTHPIDMAWLKEEASRRIAAATGAEAGCVTTGAAAGIALSVAACIGERDGVALQAGHDIDFGAPVVTMVELGGGSPILAGTTERITAGDLDIALTNAAALLFIQSHHVHAVDRVSLAECLDLTHARGIPVILDAAAEEDLRMYIAMGVDLVIYSGGKALGALSSSGFVAGRADLIAAVRAQERGIGRAMKVGPEQLASICIALDFHGSAHHDDTAVLRVLSEGTASLTGATFAIIPDEAGRAIQRLEVRTPDAIGLARRLREHTPPIYVRAHHAAEGRIAIDPRNLTVEDAGVVVGALRELLG